MLLGNLHFTPPSDKLGIPAWLSLPAEAPKLDKSPKDKETKTLADLQVEMAKKIEDEKEKISYLQQLSKDNSEHLPTLVATLEAIKSKDDPANRDATLKACDAIFALIDEQELARALGYSSKNAESAAEKKAAKVTADRKSALLLAYDRKAAVLYQQLQPTSERSNPETPESQRFVNVSATSSPTSTPSQSSATDSPATSAFSTLLASYRKWVESDNKYTLHSAREAMLQGRYGTALASVRAVVCISCLQSKDDADRSCADEGFGQRV